MSFRSYVLCSAIYISSAIFCSHFSPQSLYHKKEVVMAKGKNNQTMVDYWHQPMFEVKTEKSSEKKTRNDGADNNNNPNKGTEIVFKVHMHCEGCARKVFNCLRGFEGVEEVKTDMKANRVVVKGQKADPLKVLQRIKKKYSPNAELLYPKPKAEKKEPPKKKEPVPNKVVVLKMYMHCESCANDIKKNIEKMKGIVNVEPDRDKSRVTVRGSFDPPKLVEAITKQLGKYAEIVGREGDDPKEIGREKGNNVGKEEIIFHYPPQYSLQHIYPTQIFSDENIFSCSIM